MSYAELLKDPRWQKKRLEIMERDEWTCQACGDTEATLTVHHKSYRMVGGKFVDIWDYDGSDLITLCDGCHGLEEEHLNLDKKNIFFDLRSLLDSSHEFDCLLNLLNGIIAITGRRISDMDLTFLSVAYNSLYNDTDDQYQMHLDLEEALGKNDKV